MTLKELGHCDHIRRGDRIVEFKKVGISYYGVCAKCRGFMRWDNWTKLSEPLRAKCTLCGLCIPSVEVDLQIEEIEKSLSTDPSHASYPS